VKYIERTEVVCHGDAGFVFAAPPTVWGGRGSSRGADRPAQLPIGTILMGNEKLCSSEPTVDCTMR
jgi:hypothetical protein